METMQNPLDTLKTTVSDIAVQYPGALEVFNTYHIDYCCGGQKPFADACAKVGADPGKVMNEIIATDRNHQAAALRFNQWQPTLLADFIVQNHHTYVRESIPQLKELIDKVCMVHGEEEPKLYDVKRNFASLSNELLQHMVKEEQILFPAINSLYGVGKPLPIELDQPIAVMEDEHDHAGALIKAIRTLTNDYTPPAFACPTFQITYKLLKEFDEDLMQHIHLENNILFPKVKQHQQMSTL